MYLAYPGTTCLSTPSLLCFILTNARGGSTPFVLLLICAEVSAGINAISVELRIPVLRNCVLSPVQSTASRCTTNSSTSFLYVSTGSIPSEYFVSLFNGHAPNSSARSALAFIK